MRINPVNVQTYFSGLWSSKRTETQSIAGRPTTFCDTNIDYYPFQDEKPKDIKKFVKEHELYLFQDLDDDCFIYNSYVNVKERLPFTKGEFIFYQNSRSFMHDKQREEIEQTIKERSITGGASLYKYYSD